MHCRLILCWKQSTSKAFVQGPQRACVDLQAAKAPGTPARRGAWRQKAIAAAQAPTAAAYFVGRRAAARAVRRLPPNVQLSLLSLPDKSLDELALIADGMLDFKPHVPGAATTEIPDISSIRSDLKRPWSWNLRRHNNSLSFRQET